jgi:hypothetical protein
MTKQEFMALRHNDTITIENVTYTVIKAPDDAPPFRSQRSDEIELQEIAAEHRKIMEYEVVDCWTPGRWGGAKLILPELAPEVSPDA